MNTKDDRSQENPGAHQSSKSRPMKVYTCNFCKRKLYNSQALGGHQNAHKRERDATRRSYQSPAMTNLAANFTVNRSLGVHAHSLVQTPSSDEETNVARFTGVTWMQPYHGEETVELKWPGGFYLEAQPASQLSDQHMLDLSLKL